MNLPYNWGRPTAVPGVFALGGGEWEITWSPDKPHPYAIFWIDQSHRFGPPGNLAPDEDLWFYGLQTKPTAR
ncbi:MAG: hypothetical protein ACM3XM_10480 [Mycobacterium leprae]